mgnify:CR=1 FL=1
MKKRKILYLSDSSNAKTGFGNVSLDLLSYLYSTQKYDIIHACQGVTRYTPDFEKVPWKCVGVIPMDQNEINRMNSDPGYGRYTAYGGTTIDSLILEYKPDTIIVINDPWGSSDFCAEKKFWNKLNSIAWVTYDSEPLYQKSLDQIKLLQNLYCWSSFAEKEFHRLGHTHVKTQFPPIDTTKYYPLSQEEKSKIRKEFNIPENIFLVQYVFRNQLRKQSHTIIKGYSELQKKCPEIANNIYLFFHTSVSEGWDHKKFCKDANVDYNRILYTWICQNCKKIEIKADNGQTDCKFCNAQKSQITPNVGFGATIKQMNQIYNVADCFTLVANSGATERPGLEAMSCGLPLCTINYSYGFDFCKNDFVYKLRYDKSIEFGTQFLKATPNESDIMDFIIKIFNLSKQERFEIGQKSRKWIIDNFDLKKVGKDWENILDSLPESNWNFDFSDTKKDPEAIVPPSENNVHYIRSLYKEILKMDLDESDEGFRSWIYRLQQGQSKEEIEKFFRSVALTKNQEIEQQKNQINVGFESLLNKNDKKRILLIIPESVGDVFMVTSLFQSIRNRYSKPEWSFYVATKKEYFDILQGNEYIDRILEYIPQMDNLIWLEGQGSHKGYFDVVYPIYYGTQRLLNYLHNTTDKLDLQLN